MKGGIGVGVGDSVGWDVDRDVGDGIDISDGIHIGIEDESKFGYSN